MTAMESPAIKVTSYDDDNDIYKKRQDDDDDLDRDLESFINERKEEESKEDNKYMDDDNLQESEPSKLNDDDNKEEKRDDKDEKEDEKKETRDEKRNSDDDMKDDERDSKVTEIEEKYEDKSKNDDKDEPTEKIDDLEKGQKETMSKGEKEKTTDDEDSEPDDYNITEDQRRALQEIEFLKNEMGLPEEDPPEYDVKDRLKTLNEELANDPTPVEKLKESKVVFKDNPVDLVAPPPDYPEEETPRKEEDSKSKPSGDSESKTNHKVLIERDGKFELVNADDIEAQDLGLIVFDSQNKNNSNSNSGNTQDFNRKPAPPSQPRPSTANGSSSRRNVRPGTSKPRASSAGPHRGLNLEDFNYDSPYAMSKEEKDLQGKQSKRKEEQQKKKQQLEKKEMEERQTENNCAFQAWLRQKREQHKKQREQEQKEKKKNTPEDNRKDSDSDYNGTESNESMQNEQNDRMSKTSGTDSYEQLLSDVDMESEDVKAAYKEWVKTKVTQIRKEKLLKKRLEMEATDGFYIRSREECDQAFKSWLRHKNSEAKKARLIEKQKARLHRLAARRARKAMTLTKAITFSDDFRYVDYYGYRY